MRCPNKSLTCVQNRDLLLREEEDCGSYCCMSSHFLINSPVNVSKVFYVNGRIHEGFCSLVTPHFTSLRYDTLRYVLNYDCKVI